MTDMTRIPPTLEALRTRRDEIMRLMEQYGAYNVRVFGSVARGDAGPESDVDLLVSFRKGASMYDLSGLRLDLTESLGWAVNVVSDHPRLRERFRQNIQREAVPL